MRALVTVCYKTPETSSMGIVPDIDIVTGQSEENFVIALRLFLMGCQLGGRTISSHTITLLSDGK